MTIKELEDKYIDLLLNRCINFDKSKSLLINYNIENQNFIDKLVEKANEIGIYDIYLDKEDIFLKHNVLKKIEYDNIKNEKIFNKDIWDIYASKGASFLLLRSSYPGLMDDINPKKLSYATYIERTTCKIYRELQKEFKIPWCIATLPSETWAKKIFPEYDSKKAYEELFKLIFKICMVDFENPILNWNNFLSYQKTIQDKLNLLKIKKLHYKNSLGTDLHLTLPKNVIWQIAGSLGDNMLVNLPTYEIFASPDYRYTNGKVYSSRPLCYNGKIIKNFYLEFKDGKVVDYDALEGKELLGEIINSDNYSCFLGEIALVNYDSPISKLNTIFYETTIDENASCHLALGEGFGECIIKGQEMTENELLENGICQSRNHVDFMVGTNDLEIVADTEFGKKLIMKNGNIVL